MIWESHYWKDDLLHYARFIRKKSRPCEWSDSDFAKLEKTVMLGFYTIRKLIEAEKVATRFKTFQLNIHIYPPSGKLVTRMNWHKIDILFDLSRPRKESRDLRFLADQAIHSYVFQEGIGEQGELNSVLLASDRQRSKGLLEIQSKDLISVFTEIGKNYPSSSFSTLNDESKDYEIYSE